VLVFLNRTGIGPPARYHVGDRLGGVAIGDLDGDGHPDLVAVAWAGGAGVSEAVVFRNVGDGSLAAPVRHEVIGQPESVAIADFTGDSWPDLVVANEAGFGLDVLPNLGDGSFGSPVRTPGCSHMLSVADLDGDGALDAVGAGQSTICLLHNRGGGAFHVERVETGLFATSLAAGDLDGDGVSEVLVGLFDQFASDTPSANTIRVLAVEGAGFRAVGEYRVPFIPHTVALADLNRDARLDIIGSNGEGIVFVLVNDGGGGFGAATGYGGSGPIALGDLDGDGILDVVLAGDRGIAVIPGAGDGALRVAPSYPAELRPELVIARDLDSDGMADLVVAGSGPGVGVLLATGGGGFGPASLIIEDAGAAAVGDFDGDGAQDVVAARRSTDVDPGSVVVSYGRGDGSFGPSTDLAFGLSASEVVTGDFDGDGGLDIALIDTNYPAVAVLMNRGARRFVGPVNYGVSDERWPLSLAVGEINGDCADDIAFADRYDSRGIGLLLTRGGSGFRIAPNVATDMNPFSLSVMDVDGDHRSDLVIPSGTGVAVLSGDGRGGFAASSGPAGAAASDVVASIAAGDLDGDGRSDLVLTGITALVNDGGGRFVPAGTYLGGRGRVALGDVDGDGLPDVLVANPLSGVAVLLNRSR
jgi:hypothetical protein